MRMKGTCALVAIGAFLLLTTLVAESESFGNLVNGGKRQLDRKVCVLETSELYTTKTVQPYMFFVRACQVYKGNNNSRKRHNIL